MSCICEQRNTNVNKLVWKDQSLYYYCIYRVFSTANIPNLNSNLSNFKFHNSVHNDLICDLEEKKKEKEKLTVTFLFFLFRYLKNHDKAWARLVLLIYWN